MNMVGIWACHLGSAIFLGSIATYVVVSSLTARASLDDLVFARRVIRAGTLWLTTPALWLAVLARGWVASSGATPIRLAWETTPIRLAAAVVMIATTHLVILPATRKCLELAQRSRTEQRRLPEYRRAYLTESVLGGVNVVLGLLFLLNTP